MSDEITSMFDEQKRLRSLVAERDSTIERQTADMQAREESYMDALAAKSIRIDEQATLIESLQTEIARLRAGAMPEEVREIIKGSLSRYYQETTDWHPNEGGEGERIKIAAARHWLESQQAAAEEPAEKRCGTCANLNGRERFSPSVRRAPPVRAIRR